ncbi:MAG: serine hydrolase [Rudaea sp.]|uniref:serine hydrolase domain-containing protein n=1 Tax=Rudaea sp. 3F27F6 TaxID=2502208 RepID=UPI0010F73107|nr:serine hydrolase [Rudaea sp. 3F27F6]MBN8888252.1 serine hydrolase [Rudaea sp.]
MQTVNRERRVFLNRLGLTAFVAGLDYVLPGAALARADAAPEALGVDSAAVRVFLDAVAASTYEVHSLIVARQGRIAARGWWAPYRAEAPQLLYSLSKSFTSTAVGFAVAAGKLKLSDKAVDFFPGQAPKPIGEHLGALRVEHLLTMSVGQANDATPAVTREQDWVRSFLALPIEFQPGSVFLYNSAATYMLSAIVQKTIGEKLVDYLRPRFFDPLELPPMRWAECPRGINTGGWGLSATTETLSKFGQFYLQKGKWKGRQLLPAAWIEQATSFKIQQPPGSGQDLAQLKRDSDWHQGYGYQFWRCRHNAYRGDGAFGQYCIVLPELDAVIALTGRTLDMQGLLNLVWDHLLPGLHAGALRADAAAADKLGAQLSALSLKLPEGARTSPRQMQRADYVVETNALGVERLGLAFDADSCRIEFGIGARTHVVTCGLGRWRDGETELPGTPPEFTELIGSYVSPKVPAKLAAAGAWKDADTLQMQWRYYETPHFDTVTLKFSGDKVEVAFLNSLTQMAAAVHPETRPVLKASPRT